MNLLWRRSDKRIVMVLFGLINYVSMKVGMNKNFRKDSKMILRLNSL